MTEDREPGILATCETLHMLATGSLDGVSQDEMLRLETYLQRRLDGWNHRTGYNPLHNLYDTTVRQLATIATAEWRACPWHPNASKAEVAK